SLNQQIINTQTHFIMKIKALLLGLLIAGATAVTYTAQDSNADYASKKIEKSKIVIPSNG
ncbi:MAG: hypothetical protein VX226_06650, partial [Bacteroidota bacterium]|nr:hypothetical protein [Bacteroidota bacterium]